MQRLTETLVFQDTNKSFVFILSNLGFEDLLWILFLVIVIVFFVMKATTRLSLTQLFYMWLGCNMLLVVLYILGNAFNKFVLEDSSTAHWNAHARFTQAAIQERLKEEEQRVHVIAPPKMGGAKLNIIYTVGDVPLARDNSGRSSGSGRPSAGSLGLNSGTTGVGSNSSLPATTNITTSTVALTSTGNATTLIAPAAAALSSEKTSPLNTPPNTKGLYNIHCILYNI